MPYQIHCLFSFSDILTLLISLKTIYFLLEELIFFTSHQVLLLLIFWLDFLKNLCYQYVQLYYLLPVWTTILLQVIVMVRDK